MPLFLCRMRKTTGQSPSMVQASFLLDTRLFEIFKTQSNIVLMYIVDGIYNGTFKKYYTSIYLCLLFELHFMFQYIIAFALKRSRSEIGTRMSPPDILVTSRPFVIPMRPWQGIKRRGL